MKWVHVGIPGPAIQTLQSSKFFSSKELVPKHDFRLDSQTSNFCSIARPNRFFWKGSGHETSMLWHVLLSIDINYRSLLQNYSLCKMVVTFMFRVEASATEIKIEPSNQSSFWRVNQAINVTSKPIKTCGSNLTFDPLKPSNQELQKETIKQSICQLKSWPQSQALQQATHKWLSFVIVMFYKVGVAMYDFGENSYTL